MLPNVNIAIKDGALQRTTATDDGVAAMVLTGIAATGLGLNTPWRIFSLQEAEALGITLATHPYAYTQIKDFYDQTLSGAELWIILISEATTADAVFTASSGPMDKLLNAAGGRVTIAATGMGRATNYVPTPTGILDFNISTVAALAQTLANAYAARFAYVRMVIDGTYLINPLTGVTSIKGLGQNVSVFLGATETGKRVSSIGRFLGRLAAIPVHQSVARVKTGIFSANGFLTSGLALSAYSEGQLGSLHDAGYMVLRSYMGLAGAYVSDDITLAAADSDFSSIAHGRVMDKAARLAYQAYVNELHDTVELTSEGLLAPNTVSYLEDVMNRRLRQRMIAEGNCSDATTYVDPSQKILETDSLTVNVAILPLGTLKWINVQLGFTTQIVS